MPRPKKSPQSTTVKQTTKYNLFTHNPDNRLIKLQRHRKLALSMEQYGFLPWWPIVVCQTANNLFEIQDGQHRFELSKRLKLPVWYLVADYKVDIPQVNDTPKNWSLLDYVEVHIANGLVDYQEGLDFIQKYRIGIPPGFCLLAGVNSWGNLQQGFRAGKFEVLDRKGADKVMSVYSPIQGMSPESMRNSRFLDAVIDCCQLAEFDPQRMVQSAQKSTDKLVSASNRIGYLKIMEEIYNYRKRDLLPLVILVEQARRDKKNDNQKKRLQKKRLQEEEGSENIKEDEES